MPDEIPSQTWWGLVSSFPNRLTKRISHHPYFFVWTLCLNVQVSAIRAIGQNHEPE